MGWVAPRRGPSQKIFLTTSTSSLLASSSLCSWSSGHPPSRSQKSTGATGISKMTISRPQLWRVNTKSSKWYVTLLHKSESNKLVTTHRSTIFYFLPLQVLALVGVFLFCWGPYASLSLAGRLNNLCERQIEIFWVGNFHNKGENINYGKKHEASLCQYKSKILRSDDARNAGAWQLCAAAAHRVPAADGQDLGPLEPAHLRLHEHLSKYKSSKVLLQFILCERIMS